MCKKEIGTLQHFKKLQNIRFFFLQGILSCRFPSVIRFSATSWSSRFLTLVHYSLIVV